ncbi:MAG: hypothetical protein QW767_05390, partial [Thermoprotei archaeon]
MFEYPVLTGSFFYACAYLAIHFFPRASLEAYYVITSLTFYAFTLGTAHETMAVASHVTKKPFVPVLLFFALAPSLWFYTTYNWYILGAFTMAFALNKYVQGRHGWAGVLLGLSAATSLVTAVPLV